jgi:hypothetical protein
MRFASQFARAAALAFCATGALAHEGHGLTGLHWHTSDSAGFAFIAVVAGLALWFSRGK